MRLKPISADMGAFLVSRSKQSVATPKPNGARQASGAFRLLQCLCYEAR